MKKPILLLLVVALFFLCPVHSLLAATWSVNGHEYLAISYSTSISWEAAQQEANDTGWYLATVTSQAELDFISSSLLSGVERENLWLGGFQGDNHGNSASGDWQWVTGETWDFSRWRSGEPNDGLDGVENGTEDYLMIYTYPGTPYTYQWNDVSGTGSSIKGYIMERASLVPVPGTVFLLAFGLAGLSGLARRCNQ